MFQVHSHFLSFEINEWVNMPQRILKEAISSLTGDLIVEVVHVWLIKCSLISYEIHVNTFPTYFFLFF